MSKINEKGVLIFYDWLDRLKEAQLEPEDALSVIYALADYSRYGENPVDKVDVPLKYAVGIMVDQIKRAEETAEQNKKNVQKRWNKNTSTEQQNVLRRNTANYGVIPSDTDELRRNTTNTNTNTDTDTVPPYNPPEGKKKKKTNNHSSIIGTEERDKLIRKFFRMYGNPDDDELDFIAYNEARDWIGIGNENILKNEMTLERYVSRWCRSENVRFGRKESESL